MGKHREGTVVEFRPADGEAWVGNFVRGLTQFSSAVLHPNRRSVVVVSRGQVYVVDPARRALIETFGGMIQDLLSIPERELLIFQTPLDFFALNPDGRVWETPRLALDGFRSVRILGDRVLGEACDVGNRWVPFEIDLNSGNVRGGSPYFKE